MTLEELNARIDAQEKTIATLSDQIILIDQQRRSDNQTCIEKFHGLKARFDGLTGGIEKLWSMIDDIKNK